MTSPDDGTDGGQRRTFTPDFLTELFRNPLDPGYAEAAARKARGEGPAGARRRMLSGVSALTLAGVGFLLVVAYQQTVADEPARARARNTLVEQVQSRREATGELQARAERLRAEVASLREQQLGGAAVARLRDLEAETGLAPVHGNGVRVTVGDGPTPIDPVTGERRNEARVRDTDLQLATNALWAAGAEAIAVNGQRLTATSTIRQAGEAILVDFRPVTTPYQVIAIGPEDLLKDFRDGAAGKFFRALNTKYAMSYDVAPVRGVTLDAATEPTLRQATAATPAPPPSAPSTTPSKGGR
ncbi:membrane protein [Actinoplanes sp. NBRC 14428]|uniref:Uncharacterized protein YlxW (UPF0749 family) n=1 Tax=Pseudosporangium ferrugineum TaxID=439699 RepID=A0A2T0RKL3_9ACTN|nr:DUF881 domain-containing protein [Pseudosporangium ferrugineum]PRY21660.1 uncharacterized protein YlxW (UPF0749 family) [Pseudosporangium ferrugineum]BCJ49259.1 membrane protein [Actinoplanes sp. NBRC 14428]